MALATAAIGVLHTPFARPWLMRLGGCPLAGAKMTPVEMENARHIALAHERGTGTAPARPAVGFTLDATTLADVHAWAARSHADCEDPHPGLVRCVNVTPAAVGLDPAEGRIDELALGFDTRGRLVNETTFRAHLGVRRRRRTRPRASSTPWPPGSGRPTTTRATSARPTSSQPTADSISAVSYRYSDYVADVSAMNLGFGPPRSRALHVREGLRTAGQRGRRPAKRTTPGRRGRGPAKLSDALALHIPAQARRRDGRTPGPRQNVHRPQDRAVPLLAGVPHPDVQRRVVPAGSPRQPPAPLVLRPAQRGGPGGASRGRARRARRHAPLPRHRRRRRHLRRDEQHARAALAASGIGA